MVVRVLIWNLYDSQTTIDELKESLPELESPSGWIWNEATERFGAVLHGEEPPEAIGWATDLIGSGADVYEEFDLVDV
jgi:hypothetical protein